eukprot:PhM_4_TR1487/c0_g1_i1/m.56179/K03020/RPC19, POLR1D; DNA-directed RNA polymerases I and III subunit RPAC2
MSARDICYKFHQQLKAAQDEDVVVDSELRPKVLFEIQRVDAKNNCAVVHFHNEDHTLGNPLRHVLMSRSDVRAAGYVIPHPLESMMKLQVQCEGAAPEVVSEALTTLEKVCLATKDVFLGAVEEHARAQHAE